MKIISFVGALFLVGYLAITSIVHGASLSGVVCTMDYNPVCASTPVQCITAPCDPVKQTFPNSCVAKAAGAKSFTSGACETTVPPVVGDDKDSHGCIASAGYTWSATDNKCIRAWEKRKSPAQLIQSGSWILESYN